MSDSKYLNDPLRPDWHNPLRPASENLLFKSAERPTVVQGSTPLAEQRAKDGSQLGTERLAKGVQGPGPDLHLSEFDEHNEDLSKSRETAPELDPEEVVKAFLNS